MLFVSLQNNMQINPKEILDRKILVPCQHTEIQQVGIDLSLSEHVMLKHGEARNVLLNESLYLPIDVYATFTHRSTFNRRCVLITGSIYDPGYEGKIGCTIYNMSGMDQLIEANTRVGQMVFYSAQAASEYTGQYQREHLS